jgi:hypothetical protein
MAMFNERRKNCATIVSPLLCLKLYLFSLPKGIDFHVVAIISIPGIVIDGMIKARNDANSYG